MTLPPLTNQQHAILLLIYHYRFLNRTHIQTLLGHKDKRRINAWLSDLTTKDYIKRIYSTHFGENTKPAIFYIGPQGLKLIKAQEVGTKEELKKRYRESSRSEAFIRQRLLVVDIALEFFGKEETPGKTYRIITDADMSRDPESYEFLCELEPAMILISEKKNTSTAYLLELIAPTVPKHSIRKRIRNYIEFYEGGSWESNSEHPFPIILFVCPDKPALIYSKRYVKKLKEEDELPEHLQLWFATEEAVQVQGVMSEIWEEV